MDTNKLTTPQKGNSTAIWANKTGHSSNGSSSEAITTPCSGDSNVTTKKLVHPRTPNERSAAASVLSAGSLSPFRASVLSGSTPPAKRFHRVRNPFEAALAERLHLPLIGSPSLFQRPATPQMSSTQFEWTIEEVSSLKPANVEPHETQFHDSPDPELEAKAQSAISSYFKENQIVPSPVDCPLRNQRIILSDLSGDTPCSKPRRRDCAVQTELSLPFLLPQQLEDALRPFFQPHLADANEFYASYSVSHSESNSYSGGSDVKDVSLRRKLFDMHNILVLDNEANMSMAMLTRKQRQSSSSPSERAAFQQTAIAGKLSDSLDKSSFGSLSPISATEGLSFSSNSTQGSASRRKSRLRNFLHDLDEMEPLSPIHPPVASKIHASKLSRHTLRRAISYPENYRTELNNSDVSMTIPTENQQAGKFTPDRSSSPLPTINCTAVSSNNSIDDKVRGLVVNSAKCESLAKNNIVNKPSTQPQSQPLNETDDMFNGDIDVDEDEEMQVSGRSSNCSSNNSVDTPRSKRRSASRKNLSQSFCKNWYAEIEEIVEDVANKDNGTWPKISINKLEKLITEQRETQSHETNINAPTDAANKLSVEGQHGTFYRTDSGFNEMSCSSAIAQDEDEGGSHDVTVKIDTNNDISMIIV